jgi:hypothetical protein
MARDPRHDVLFDAPGDHDQVVLLDSTPAECGHSAETAGCKTKARGRRSRPRPPAAG